MDMNLELVVIPVADVDRAKEFYTGLGWRLDVDVVTDGDFRGVQLTPPGSATSVIFGKNVTAQTPGTAQGLHLVVDDIEKAHDTLERAGADPSEVFHDASGIFHRAGTDGRVSGPDPKHSSYGSFVSFNDPDGNGWMMQEVTNRLPGRVDPSVTQFRSADDLAGAMRRASVAHGEHEKRIGAEDPNWPDWYARYMVSEWAGTEPPT